jgi:hypothetical protein
LRLTTDDLRRPNSSSRGFIKGMMNNTKKK